MKPETKALYPLNWKQISRWTIEARGAQCEKCGCTREDDGIVLTLHHIDYDPSNNDPNNLVVLCQGCHLRRQAWELANATRFVNIEKLIRMGQLELPGFELPKAKNYVQALRDRASATSQRTGHHARQGSEQ
jgi:hypothetical protein